MIQRMLKFPSQGSLILFSLKRIALIPQWGGAGVLNFHSSWKVRKVQHGQFISFSICMSFFPDNFSGAIEEVWENAYISERRSIPKKSIQRFRIETGRYQSSSSRVVWNMNMLETLPLTASWDRWQSWSALEINFLWQLVRSEGILTCTYFMVTWLRKRTFKLYYVM